MANKTSQLFLQITGSSDGLTKAAKAARVSMADLGQASGDLQQVVADNFAKLGGSNLAQTARQMEADFRRTFANIRASAEETLSKPITANTVISTNIKGAEAALASAEATAETYRRLSDAQSQLVTSSASASEGEKRLAVALEAEALSAKESVSGLQQQLATLRQLGVALGVTAEAEEEVSRTHGRMGASGMIAEHVVRSFSDSVAAGQSPVRALSMEIPRMAEALQFLANESNATQGAMGKFAGFMGGGWGIALTVGISLLSPLVEKLFEGSEASEGMKHKVETLVAALNDEAGATNAARKALADYNAEKQRGRDSDAQATQATLEKTKADLQAAIATRQRLQAEAQRFFNEKAVNPMGGQAALAFAGLALDRQANNQTPLITGLQEAVRNIEIDQAKDAAKAAADPIEAIRQKYKQLAVAAEAAAAKNDRLAVSLKGALSGYAISEAAEIKAEQKRQSDQRAEQRDNHQIGRQITLEQAESIVQGFGGRITSAYRSTAEQQVLYDRYKAGTGPLAAKPGTSNHESGQALDIGKAAGISLATIRKAFEQQGVRLTELLDEGNHYHVAFGPKGPSAETLAKRNRAATTKSADEDRAFQADLARAKDAQLKATEALGASSEDRLEDSLAQIETDKIARDREIRDQVIAGKITQARADQLLALEAETTAARASLALRTKALDDEGRALEASRSSRETRNQLLSIDEQLSPSRTKRLGDATEMLRNDQASRREQLQHQINTELDPDRKRDLQARYDDLPKVDAAELKSVNFKYQDPLQAERQRLQGSVGDIGDDLSTIKVDAIEHLGDSLDTAATKALKLHGLLGDIAGDILKMLIQREIELPIANFLSGSLSGGGKSGGVLGSLFSGASKLFHIPGFATGTDSAPGGMALVGEDGPELVNLPRGASVTPSARTLSMLSGVSVPTRVRDLSPADARSLTAARPAQVVVHVEANDYFDARVGSISGAHVQAAAPSTAAAGAQIAQQDAVRRQRRRLGG